MKMNGILSPKQLEMFGQKPLREKLKYIISEKTFKKHVSLSGKIQEQIGLERCYQIPCRMRWNTLRK